MNLIQTVYYTVTQAAGTAVATLQMPVKGWLMGINLNMMQTAGGGSAGYGRLIVGRAGEIGAGFTLNNSMKNNLAMLNASNPAGAGFAIVIANQYFPLCIPVDVNTEFQIGSQASVITVECHALMYIYDRPL